jgi:hypothetical protein
MDWHKQSVPIRLYRLFLRDRAKLATFNGHNFLDYGLLNVPINKFPQKGKFDYSARESFLEQYGLFKKV